MALLSAMLILLSFAGCSEDDMIIKFKPNEGDKYEVLSDLKKHINELGTEISKENVSNEMQYLYKVLLNFNK